MSTKREGQDGPQVVPDEILDQVVGGAGAPMRGAVNFADLSTMDLETALQKVQQDHAQMRNAQQETAAGDVAAHNKQIADASSALVSLNTIIDLIDQKGGADHTVSLSDEQAGAMNEALKTLLGNVDSLHGKTLDANNDHQISRSEAEDLKELVKGTIDSMNAQQQLDLLRLQALTGKRSEAFQQMTDFIRRSQDTRESLIGNMR